MGSWLPLGIHSIADRPLGVGPRPLVSGGWGHIAHNEMLPTQVIGLETTQFFLTKVLKLN